MRAIGPVMMMVVMTVTRLLQQIQLCAGDLKIIGAVGIQPEPLDLRVTAQVYIYIDEKCRRIFPRAVLIPKPRRYRKILRTAGEQQTVGNIEIRRVGNPDSRLGDRFRCGSKQKEKQEEPKQLLHWSLHRDK